MRIRHSLVLVLVLFLPACGSNTPSAPPPVENGAALSEIAEVYRYFSVQKLPAPRKVDDLVEFEGTLAGALPKIRNGELVVVWGLTYASGSTQVLAYEKDAPTNGGKVLLRSGAVKDMTATEFQAAKK